jgi:hypothetical protein
MYNEWMDGAHKQQCAGGIETRYRNKGIFEHVCKQGCRRNNNDALLPICVAVSAAAPWSTFGMYTAFVTLNPCPVNPRLVYKMHGRP